MKILAKLCENPELFALISVGDKRTREKVHMLIGRGRYEQAMFCALEKSDSFKEIRAAERNTVSADLFLTKNNAHWDLTV